jgi:hypothetical protein
MNRREFVTSSVCACLATTVARVGAAFGAEDGPITVGGKQYASRKGEMRESRGEDAAWIKPLEETLKERGARLEAAKTPG